MGRESKWTADGGAFLDSVGSRGCIRCRGRGDGVICGSGLEVMLLNSDDEFSFESIVGGGT